MEATCRKVPNSVKSINSWIERTGNKKEFKVKLVNNMYCTKCYTLFARDPEGNWVARFNSPNPLDVVQLLTSFLPVDF